LEKVLQRRPKIYLETPLMLASMEGYCYAKKSKNKKKIALIEEALKAQQKKPT
jgi:hypothetical protein